jgi:hypothetical protein
LLIQRYWRFRGFETIQWVTLTLFRVFTPARLSASTPADDAFGCSEFSTKSIAKKGNLDRRAPSLRTS